MVYRTLTLAAVALWSAQAAAADMEGVYVAPGGIYAPAAQVYVRPAPDYAPPIYAPPAYPHAYVPPAYAPPPVYPAPAYFPPRRVYAVPAPIYRAPGYAAPPYWARPYGYGSALSYVEPPIVRPPAVVPYAAAAPCVVDGGYGQLEHCN
jgi:hypothetical protein